MMNNYFKTTFIILALVMFFIRCSHASDDDPIQLKPIVITPDLETSYKEEILAPKQTESKETLDFNDSFVDARVRGVKDIQEDLSIRGSTFEEVAVILNDVKLNDPQSGHFNTDIPLTRFDIAQVDFVYGSISSLYGSSGMAGGIIIEPEKPKDKPQVEAYAEYGQYDFYDTGVSLNLPINILKNKISFEIAESSGYRPETEFKKITANYSSVIDLDIAEAEFMFGYLKKDFGADSFYSDIYNNEEEHTDTRLIQASLKFENDDTIFKPVFYYRRHWDKFILDRNRPDWSTNIHKNYLYGVNIIMYANTEFGKLKYGTEFSSEKINSTSLKKHIRHIQSFYLSNVYEQERFLLEAAARIDNYSDFGFQFNPSCAGSFSLNESLTIKASAGRSFRAPSFTDLYYVGKANMGNPDLKPEMGWDFDVTLEYLKEFICLKQTAFFRITRNTIDWTRDDGATVWRSDNIGEFDIVGSQTNFTIYPKEFLPAKSFTKFNLKYSFMQSTNHENINSKYILNYLKHDLSSVLFFDLPYNIKNKWSLSFKKRISYDPYLVVSTEITKTVRYKEHKLEFFIKGDNLTNTIYMEVGNVKMPGIWVTVGVKAEI